VTGENKTWPRGRDILASERSVTVAHPSLLIGLIGAGIGGSLSPALHEREATEQGRRAIYRLIDLERLGLGVADLPELLRAAELMSFTGLNITHPCKQAVIPLLDELSDEARMLGAANTVLLRDGRRIGHNTDWWGFAEAFRRNLPGAALGHVVQLGAGGAGAAVAHAALTLGVVGLTIVDAQPGRAEALAARLARHHGEGRVFAGTDLAQAMGRADGLIHCTPTGMAGHPALPLSAELLRPSLWVADIVYVPLETPLLRAAGARGCRVLDGGGMVVFQAAEAFRLFTGIVPDAGRMLRHFADMTAGGEAAAAE
jgi:shikimate dehydrogenase